MSHLFRMAAFVTSQLPCLPEQLFLLGASEGACKPVGGSEFFVG